MIKANATVALQQALLKWVMGKFQTAAWCIFGCAFLWKYLVFNEASKRCFNAALFVVLWLSFEPTLKSLPLGDKWSNSVVSFHEWLASASLHYMMSAAKWAVGTTYRTLFGATL